MKRDRVCGTIVKNISLCAQKSQEYSERKIRMKIGKYSMGIGDRFGRQGAAQLQAIMTAREMGVDIDPVWNKSHREHEITGTAPTEQRLRADEAVKRLDYSGRYFVDADHIGMDTVDRFLDHCDFFTLDVADYLGVPPIDAAVDDFINTHNDLVGTHQIPGIERPLEISTEELRRIAGRALAAVSEAGRIYRHIESKKGRDTFITEVSMDETNTPQTPVELLVILAAIADEKIPAQTIAPRFSGRFNKGVDYVGDVDRFAREFEADVAVIDFAVSRFDLPRNLKLSIHSGSDKFSIYPAIGEGLRKFDAGIHLKTAGTTWLEELIGLAESGGSGLDIAREIYRKSYIKHADLIKPYSAVVDIRIDRLPPPDAVARWSGEQFADALRHDPSNPAYNRDLRQILHVGYKIAASMGARYLDALEEFDTVITTQVYDNILDRHIKRVFF